MHSHDTLARIPGKLVRQYYHQKLCAFAQSFLCQKGESRLYYYNLQFLYHYLTISSAFKYRFIAFFSIMC